MTARAVWANRALSLGIVLATLLGLRALVPDAGERDRIVYLLVLVPGYGHLLGAALFSVRRRRGMGRPRASVVLGGALALSLVLSLFAVYAAALPGCPALVLPLLFLAVWHAFENDLALARSDRATGRPGPVRLRGSEPLLAIGMASGSVALFLAAMPDATSAAHLARTLGNALDLGLAGAAARWLAVVAGVAAMASARGRARAPGLLLAGGSLLLPIDVSQWVRPAEVFALWSLYHIVSFQLQFATRQRERRRHDPGEARRRDRWLVVAHLVPALPCAALLLAPLEPDHLGRVVVFAPSLYLFWSAAHVVQTAAARGLSSGPGSTSRSHQ